MGTGWAWHLIEGDTLIADLADATAKKATWALHGAGTASFAMDGDDPQAALVQELITDLVVSYNGERLWRGRIGSSTDDVGTDTHDVTFNAVDYRGLLARKLVWVGRSPTAVPAVAAWDLLDDYQALTGADMGVTEGITAGGSPVALTAEWGQSLAETIDAWSKMLPNGFDWWIDADRRFNTDNFRGSGRDFGLIYGETVASVNRSFDSADYANVVRTSGGTGAAPYVAFAAGYGTRPEGRWEVQVGDTELTTDAQVIALANHELARRSALVPAYTWQLIGDLWNPDRLWVGDGCAIRCQSGRLNVDALDRVQDITITDTGDGSVDAAITTGTEFRRDLAALIHSTGERLTALARR